jgi:hypothetical protein
MKTKIPLESPIEEAAAKNGQMPKSSIDIPSEPPRILTTNVRLVFSLVVNVGDDVVSGEEFAVSVRSLNEKSLLEALAAANAKKEEMKAKVAAEYTALLAQK